MLVTLSSLVFFILLYHKINRSSITYLGKTHLPPPRPHFHIICLPP
nr:MAG TPA: hypothetical protein [Caudoviricetes sp.]